MNVLRGQQGLTLMEVLAGVVILGILVISFTSVSSYIANTNQRTDRAAEALKVAEEQLNLARAYVQSNSALPPEPLIPGYTVTLQVTDLNVSPSGYSENWFGSRHVSAQSIIYYNSALQVLTSTVSWSN